MLSIFLQRDHWLFSKRSLMVLVILVGTLFIYAAFRNPFIGYSDDANCAIVAKNVCEGKGYYTDCLYQFINPSEVHHPEELWPMLHPSVVALFFKFGGFHTAAAHLPNVLYIVLTALVTYLFAAKLTTDTRVAFISALLVLLSGRYRLGLVNSDGGTLFVLLFLMFIWHYEERQERKWLALASVFAGLAALQRTEYIFIFPLYSIVRLLIFFKGSRSLRAALKKITPFMLFGCLMLLVASPYFIKNLYYFGNPFHTVSVVFSNIVKYGSLESQYGIYYDRVLDPVSVVFSNGVLHFIKINFAWLTYCVSVIFHNLGGFVLTVFCAIGVFWGSRLLNRYRSFHLSVLSLLVFYLFFYALSVNVRPRYFWFIYPYMTIFGVSVIFEGLDKLERGNAVNSFLRILPVALIIFLSIYRFAPLCYDIFHGPTDDQKHIMEISRWLSRHSPSDALVMARQPWAISWHAGRRAIMIPQAEVDDIAAIIKKYNARYLVLDKEHNRRPQLVGAIENGRLQWSKRVYKSGWYEVYRLTY